MDVKMEKQKRCEICGDLTHDWERIDGRVQCWKCGEILREPLWSKRAMLMVERDIMKASAQNESIKKGDKDGTSN